MKFFRSQITLLILIAVSVVAIAPLFHVGFFPIHDNTQVARVYEMYKSLSSGLIPVRWVADLGYGYGYPIFSFYAPLAYYIGASVMFFGLSALIATKIMIGLGVVFAGITMYYLVRDLSDEWSGLIAGALYLYAPYHALNSYVRGAVGELWAYAFIPLAFLGFVRIMRLPSWRNIAVAVFGYAGVILSHNLTALMITPFLLFFIGVFGLRNSSKQVRLAVGLAFFLSCIVSSWYWIPAIAEIQFTNVGSIIGGGSDYPDHFVCLSQLWSSQWGFAGSAPGCIDGLSFQLGKIHILLGLFAVFLSFVVLQKKRGIILFVSAGLALSVFLMLPISRPIWDSLAFMKYLQFPWRFLQLALFFLSILGGFGVHLFIKNILPKSAKNVIAPVFILLLVIFVVSFYSKLFKPQHYYESYRDEASVKTLKWTVSKISDEYMSSTFVKPLKESDVPTHPTKPSKTISVTQIEDSPGRLYLKTTSATNSSLIINRAVFPAWVITLDNMPALVRANKGLYEVAIPAGEHILQMNFIQTPIQKFANILSIIGIAVLFVGIMRKKELFHK